MTRVFTIDITLTQPAILTDGSSDSTGGHETLGYIPGTSILGAMVATLGIDPQKDSSLFARLFLDEGTRFLNAYPVADGRRTLPRPRTFLEGKSQRWCVIDRLREDGRIRSRDDIESFFLERAEGDRVKAARQAFVLADNPGEDHSPDRREQVHVGIARETRAAEQGVLFSYESLPEGSRFSGAVIVDDADVAAVLADLARRQLTLHLGRSRSAGYGSAIAQISPAADGWREYEPGTATRPSGTPVVVCLLSDYLPPLEVPPAAALEAEVREALGVPEDRRVSLVEAGLRTVRGFRAVWGLPRPSRTAVERGAVLVVDGPLDAARISAAERSGIGSRRNEGFGRFSCGWRVHGKRAADQPHRRGSSSVKPAGGRFSLALPSDMIADVGPDGSGAGSRGALASRGAIIRTVIERRRDERRRRRFVEVVVASGKVRSVIQNLVDVPPAQLGNLRAAMTGGLEDQEIGRWFIDLASKTGGKRWRQRRVQSLRAADAAKRRDGIGFVWTSLLGGRPVDDHRSDIPEGGPDFRRAVEESLVPWCREELLVRAAMADPSRTLRMFVVALCGDIVRERNMKARRPSTKEPR